MGNGLTLADLELLVGLVAQLHPEEYPDPYVRRVIEYCRLVWQTGNLRLDLHGN